MEGQEPLVTFTVPNPYHPPLLNPSASASGGGGDGGDGGGGFAASVGDGVRMNANDVGMTTGDGAGGGGGGGGRGDGGHVIGTPLENDWPLLSRIEGIHGGGGRELHDAKQNHTAYNTHYTTTHSHAPSSSSASRPHAHGRPHGQPHGRPRRPQSAAAVRSRGGGGVGIDPFTGAFLAHPSARPTRPQRPQSARPFVAGGRAVRAAGPQRGQGGGTGGGGVKRGVRSRIGPPPAGVDPVAWRRHMGKRMVRYPKVRAHRSFVDRCDVQMAEDQTTMDLYAKGALLAKTESDTMGHIMEGGCLAPGFSRGGVSHVERVMDHSAATKMARPAKAAKEAAERAEANREANEQRYFSPYAKLALSQEPETAFATLKDTSLLLLRLSTKDVDSKTGKSRGGAKKKKMETIYGDHI